MKIVYLLLLGSLMATCVVGAEEEPVIVAPIEEGAFVDGVEGQVEKEAKTGTWHFVPDGPIKITDAISMPAKKPLEMLPCSVLDQMATMAGKEETLRVRLWGMFTLYEHTPYLFGVYFLPIEGATETPEPEDPPKEEEETKELPQERDSIIPIELLNQMKENKAPDLVKFQQVAKVTGDMNLVGRSGYLSQKNGVPLFKPDALGRNLGKKKFVLLPNNMLSTAMHELTLTPGKKRYNVSGLVTEYKGEKYLLLRRAERTYTHGNFTH